MISNEYLLKIVLVTELSSDYVMYFIKSGTTDYVATKGPAKNLLQVSRLENWENHNGQILSNSPIAAVCLLVVAIDGHFQLWYSIVVRHNVSR